MKKDNNKDNNLKDNNKDNNHIQRIDSNDIHINDMQSSMEMNVNNANVRKPGKKLINHKNKDSSFYNMHNVDNSNDYENSDKKVNKSQD